MADKLIPFHTESITESAGGIALVKLETPKDKKISGFTEALILAQKIVHDAGAPVESFLIATVFAALINPNNEQR